MSEIRIRRMQYADVKQVAAMEEGRLCHAPGASRAFRREWRRTGGARYLVAERDGRILGYAGAWVVLDECHITNIAVAEAEPGAGPGRRLLEALMPVCQQSGGRLGGSGGSGQQSSGPASLRRRGVRSVGKRKRYYEDNGEDAFLMVCEHAPGGSGFPGGTRASRNKEGKEKA